MNQQNPESSSPFDPLSIAAIVCAAADDALTADQRRALESLRQSDPLIDDRIAFESAISHRINQNLSAPVSAPASLRASIQDLFAQERDAVVGPVSTRSGAFWASKPTTWLAVAASILLLVSVGVVMNSSVGSKLGPPVGAPFAAQLVDASNFIVAEHNQCSAFDSYFERKFTVRNDADVSDAVVQLLGNPPTRIKLDQAGYEFVGMGKCTVPGAGESVHMIYRPIDQSRPTLSLFVQQASARPDIKVGVRYRLSTPVGAPVLVWKKQGLIYYLFSPDPTAESDACDLLEAPDEELNI